VLVSDQLRERINFDPGSMADELEPIPWPSGLAPSPIASDAGETSPLPSADVLIVTYTMAEGRALADVLTPGVQSTSWTDYKENWDQFEPLLGSEAPARDEDRLGSWHLTAIGNRRVVCFKSALHPDTDGPELPILKLWKQMIAEVKPTLVITTGTAGAVGLDVELGDVAIPNMVRWVCEEQFEHEDWANGHYQTTPLSAAMKTALANAQPLMTANQDKIPAQYLTRGAIKVWESGTTETSDFFAYGTTDDHFGLLKAAPNALVVEMDDAALGMALESIDGPPQFLSIRNASDPVMSSNLGLEQDREQANKIYEQYGYFTTIGSAIACWAMVTAE
jgi:nucleoside phosphorylase